MSDTTMPDSSGLPRIRHDAVNALLRYLRAVDDHDVDGVLAALGDAGVSFDGADRQSAAALAELYRTVFASAGRTRHLLHEASVEQSAHEPKRVVLRAAYQRWSLDGDEPVLTALGGYVAEFDGEGPTRLIRLSVDRDWQRA